MLQTRQFIYTFFILLTLIISSWFYNQQPQTAKLKNNDDLPDFSMENVVASDFDMQGQLNQRMYSTHLVHYKKNDTSDFTQPHLLIYKKDSPPWEINADVGRSTEGTKRITLQKNVRLHQPANKTQMQTTTVKTELLKIFPATKYAETDLPITLSQPGLTVDSVGMRAYIKESKVELLSQAKGHYGNF